MQEQIWGEVLEFYPVSSTVHPLNAKLKKILKPVHNVAKVIIKLNFRISMGYLSLLWFMTNVTLSAICQWVRDVLHIFLLSFLNGKSRLSLSNLQLPDI